MLYEFERFFFLENWQFNQKLGLHLLSINILRLKYYPWNPTRYDINETSKVPISQFFSKLGKKFEVEATIIHKIFETKSRFHVKYRTAGKV